MKDERMIGLIRVAPRTEMRYVVAGQVFEG
jgi:hypothetical protein